MEIDAEEYGIYPLPPIPHRYTLFYVDCIKSNRCK